MLLIFPPLAKACEPPAGIARLAAALQRRAIPCRMLDANLEAQLWLLDQPSAANDTWSRRAFKGRAGNLAALRDITTYQRPDHYRRAVSDINRVISSSGTGSGVTLGLSDYQHYTLSPLRSNDLIISAQVPEQNHFYTYFSQRLAGLVSGIGTVGFSLNYLSQALCTFAMIGYLKKHYPLLKIVLGGGLVTSWMQRPGWSSPFDNLVDLLVCGAGEQPLLAFLGVSADAKIDVPPDYSGLPLAEYLSPGLILPYSAASGCYWNNCSFCPERAEGNAYHPVPVTRAVSDLALLTGQAKPRLIHLLDNAVSPALLRAFAETPPGSPWYGFARIDELLVDLEFCRALKKSGCVMLKLGLESGDQAVLDRMGKGIDINVASKVLNNLAKVGIATYCYLLFGTPGETVVEARRTLQFVTNHQHAVSFLNMALFNMPRYGEEAAHYGSQALCEEDLSLYTSFRHPSGWDRKQVRSFIEYEFKRHPAVAAIVRNDPPIFSSNHAPLLARIQQISP